MISALEILDEALKEDAPQGDITCLCLKEAAPNLNENSIGYIVAKQDLIFSGFEFLQAVKELHQKNSNLNQAIQVEVFFQPSDKVLKGQKIASLYGTCSDLLLVERSLLNILGRLCGIATLTQDFVKQVESTACKILDTRKTIPLYRKFEKQAVVDGGGVNHRMSLSDVIMLKENHLQALPQSMSQIINGIRQNYPEIKIILEVQNLKQALEASQTKINQILLDNMDTEQIQACVSEIPEGIKTEASGNMTLERVKQVAETGVQYISVGALTHSAVSADISFLLE